MRKRNKMAQYIFSLFLLIVTAISANSPNSKINPENLLMVFAKDLTVSHNMYDWKESNLNNSLISWKDKVPTLAYNAFGDPIKEYSYKKDGIAILGKDRWFIRLSGARSGYTRVYFDEIQVGDTSDGLVPNKKYILEYKDCEESTSFYTSRYLIKFKDKKAFWLQGSFSSGSGGATASYSILYDTKPLCDNE